MRIINWHKFNKLNRENQKQYIDFIKSTFGSSMDQHKSFDEGFHELMCELEKNATSDEGDIEAAFKRIDNFLYQANKKEIDKYKNQLESLSSSEKYKALDYLSGVLGSFIEFEDIDRGLFLLGHIDNTLENNKFSVFLETKVEIENELSINDVFDELYLHINQMYAVLIKHKVVEDKKIIDDVSNFFLDRKEYTYLKKMNNTSTN